ncbi:MAG: glucose 1-dehydrogenase [Planctomycetes bacterium]|jgi:NAD(P)-dependent dehydrogenase (short-subunit alcohol dehydrogenase family)|nr:glucose 1-dehydrogenase [Planctomycetota bacterium]
MAEFSGRVALVTGASSGIGRATAEKLSAEGAAVALVARREKELSEVAARIAARGGRAEVVAADLSLEAECDLAVRETVARFGGLDVLVNAAGIIGGGSIETTSPVDFDHMMNVNLRSLFLLTRAATPHLVAGKGAVVNVSSVTGTRAFPGLLAYCVSKAAVDQFTRCVALELAPKGVRVNAVNPGVVVTNLHRAGGMDEAAYAKFLERCRETHPLGRAGQPEEVADLILFLASPRAAWITGGCFPVDGGRAETCAR